MVVAQKVKESEITEQDSLLLTRNLLRIAIFNISYIRGLFPEKYFSEKSVPALDMKIKKLMPVDAESRRLIDWMEKGVYDALQKKYLKTLLFCVCEAVDGQMIEEYAFSFSYSNGDSQEVSMNFNRTGNKKTGTFKCNPQTEITPNQMRSSACKMVRTLVQLMRTLDQMPEERTILLKLFYYDDVTPSDYEPPFFQGCTEEEAHNPWTKTPLKMEIGNVNSKHLILALKVKSVLDPCEDENHDDVSLDMDSTKREEDNTSDSLASTSDDDQYIVAQIDKQEIQHNSLLVDEDNTQDSVEDEQQARRVKDWISDCHLKAIELTDVLSNFPDISEALIEEIISKLVMEGVLLKAGADSYTINMQMQKSDYEFDAVKEEKEGHMHSNGKLGVGEDPIYMKALYYALPLDYITAPKLHSKMEGEANLSTVRKFIDKMSREGFVETKSNRKLGRRVIHSDSTEKKLMEIKKALDIDVMEVEANGSGNKSNHTEMENIDNNYKDLSTCGALHSIGSDVTRTRGKSDGYQNGSVRSEQTLSKGNENRATPVSRAEPVASRESFTRLTENGREIPNNKDGEEFDSTAICGRSSSQGKRFKKASKVKEPIIQYAKRQKC